MRRLAVVLLVACVRPQPEPVAKAAGPAVEQPKPEPIASAPTPEVATTSEAGVEGGAPVETTSSPPADPFKFPAPAVPVTKETACAKADECVVVPQCCQPFVGNKKHAPKKPNCAGVTCPAVALPPIVGVLCCAGACTPKYDAKDVCPP